MSATATKYVPPALERRALIAQLEKLLDVAGTQTPWATIARDLSRMSVPAIRALVYRVTQALSDSFDEGVKRGRAGDAVETARPVTRPATPSVPAPERAPEHTSGNGNGAAAVAPSSVVLDES